MTTDVQVLCKRCKYNVNSGPKCVTCDVLYNVRCATKLKNVKIFDEYKIDCCNGGNQNPNLNLTTEEVSSDFGDNKTADSVLLTENKYLKMLISQKDIL